MRGIFPLSASLDHAGPMARTVGDCEPLLAAMTATVAPADRRPLRRVVLSPRIGELEPDVAQGFDRALAELSLVEVTPPEVDLDPGSTFVDVLCAEMLAYHRRFADRRERYRPSTLGLLEHGKDRALTAEEFAAAQERRREDRWRWLDWFAEHRVDAIVEPTVPIVARLRGRGYHAPFTDVAETSLTHYWDWVGLPVVALPSGVGSRSGLPTSVSLIGSDGAEWELLAAGAALQEKLGVPLP
jgi:aspartyl-tRNA(Asn)/glutamyl-tRNA(Gln) amidotransferase subunit A